MCLLAGGESLHYGPPLLSRGGGSAAYGGPDGGDSHRPACGASDPKKTFTELASHIASPT